MTKTKKRIATKATKKTTAGKGAQTRAVKRKPGSKRRTPRKKPESIDDRVRRVALEAARAYAGNDKLTLEDEMDSDMAISMVTSSNASSALRYLEIHLKNLQVSRSKAGSAICGHCVVRISVHCCPTFVSALIVHEEVACISKAMFRRNG